MSEKDFIKAKINSFVPSLKELIGQRESGRTSELMDFMTMLHPNQSKQGQGSKGEVFGKKHFVFRIYTTGILRTESESGTRRFYPYAN